VLSHEVGVPVRLTNEVLHDLVESRVLSETRANGSKDVAYQPARAVEGLTIASVLEALADRGADALPLVESPELDKLTASLREFREALRSSPANLALKDL
jgi:membrane protein